MRGEIIYVNKRFELTFLYSTEEVLGHRIEILIPERFRESHRGHRADFLHHPVDRAMGTGREFPGLRSDGSEFPAEIGLSVGQIHGENSVIATIVDLSNRRAIGKQLFQSQKMETVGRLSAGIAHDVNNFLTVISTVASTQLQFPQDEARRLKAFSTIAQAVERGGKAVQALLRLSRGGKGEVSNLNLNALVQDQSVILGHVTMSSVVVNTQLAPEAVEIKGDHGALASVVMNLCVNALDAMAEKTTEKVLTLRTRSSEHAAVIEVEDTGTGMSPAVLKRATQPFFTTKESGKGTGLGLSLVKDVVGVHGGKVEIQSTEGKGTKVILEFPHGSAAGPSVPSVFAPPIEDVRPGLKILLVDDDEMVRQSVTDMLTEEGMVVTNASSGGNALDRLAAGLDCDLVVLERNMPGLGGDKAMGLIRVLSPTLPILLYTGLVDDTVVELVATTERTRLLKKPFTVDEMNACIQSLLGTDDSTK